MVQNNPAVYLSCALSTHSQVSCFSSLLAATAIIETSGTVSSFVAANNALLRTSYSKLAGFFKSLSIQYVPAVAGLFVLARLCDDDSEAAESDMLAKLNRRRVCLVPGQSCHCSEPGWFRITFALKATDLEEGMRRIGQAVNDFRRKRKCKDVSLGEAKCLSHSPERSCQGQLLDGEKNIESKRIKLKRY